MMRKLLWLSLPVLLGLLIAVLAVAAPAQAGNPAQGPDTPNHDLPPGVDAYGVIDNFPQHLSGEWTIGGVVYTATRFTRFKMFAGPFYQGACVHINYDPNTNMANLIETQSNTKCSENPFLYMHGLIDQVPDSYTSTLTSHMEITGTWIISGEAFISTRFTRYDTHNGPLAVGACAGVIYQQVNGENQAWMIRNEPLYHCFGPVSYNQAFGYVVTYPPDLYGAWVISDTTGMSLTFETNPSTQISDYRNPVDTGVCVWVKYFNDQGMNIAAALQTKDPKYCQGIFPGIQPLSKIYADIESMPTGTVSGTSPLTGTWMLAGVNFTATQQTRIEEENDPLAVGECAEGKYDPTNGAMLFYKLESEEPQDCQARDGSQRYSLYGVVQMLPTAGYSGTWQVSGVSFQTTPSTTVEMRFGDFTIGAYVKVYFTYDTTSGERTAQLIKTHVAPGFGWMNFHGRFGGWIHKPDGDQIILDGKAIQADPDIDLPAGIQDGDMVWVNAYQDTTGVFATQVTADQNVFLPLLHR